VAAMGDIEFASEVFTLEMAERVATLWLDNPQRRNAMGPAFWDDLPRACAVLAERADDDDVRAVVLAARGPVFSAGLDLKAMPSTIVSSADVSGAKRRATTYAHIKRLQAAISAVAELPVPVIAAVQGYCLGGGIDLITACDVRLAAADAVFSVRETRIAMVADVGTLQRLPRVIAPGHVAELVYTGRDIGAERAERIGLVNDVYPDHDSVVAAAQAMAAEIAANSPIAVKGARAVLRAGEGRSIAEGLDYVAVWNAAFIDSHDLGEALSAFVEKRQPRFTGE
jgi:enoyl-CoA hydratase